MVPHDGGKFRNGAAGLESAVGREGQEGRALGRGFVDTVYGQLAITTNKPPPTSPLLGVNSPPLAN